MSEANHAAERSYTRREITELREQRVPDPRAGSQGSPERSHAEAVNARFRRKNLQHLSVFNWRKTR